MGVPACPLPDVALRLPVAAALRGRSDGKLSQGERHEEAVPRAPDGSACGRPDRRRGGIHGRQRGAHGKRARRTRDGQPAEPACRQAGSASAEGVRDAGRGQIPQGAKVGKVAKGQYVQLTREGEDSIFTVLGQFGNQINPTYGGTAGPQRNQIEEPDRTTDNTTIWTSDFSRRTTTTYSSTTPPARTRWQLVHRAVVRSVRRQRRGHRLGRRAVQRGELRVGLLR